MKRILITVLASATAANAMAETLVFDVSMKVKTTVAKAGTINAACIVSNDTAKIVYRKQGTLDVRGLIWGCSCDSLIGPLSYTEPTADGCYFWNATDHKPIIGGTISWPVLHRIEDRMKKSEGVMEFKSDEWYLLCAGFGKVDYKKVDDKTFPLLKNLNGYFAGWRIAPKWTRTTIIQGQKCSFCESGTADITTEEELSAEAWALCTCALPSDKTVAFGTWKLKYNKSLSKNLGMEGVTSITEVYKFPNYVPIHEPEGQDK